MSIFAVGGNIGFFVGPILTASSLTAFGMHGTLVFLFPATACAAVLLCFNRRFLALGTGAKATAANGETREHWGKFALVMGVLSARSIMEYGLLAFIPLFLLGVLGQPEATSALVLSAFSIAGAFSTVLSGRASGRFGAHRLMVACFAAYAALIAAFAFNSSFIAAVAIAEPFLGMAGDAVGLVPVMLVLAAVAVTGAVLGAVVWSADRRGDAKAKQGDAGARANRA